MLPGGAHFARRLKGTDMDFFDMIVRLIMQNQGGGGGWENPGFGNIPSSPFQFPRYTSPYATGFGSPGGDLMGRPQGGIPNGIPTGQPPLPQRPLGGMGSQMANTGSGNAMLQQYLSLDGGLLGDDLLRNLRRLPRIPDRWRVHHQESLQRNRKRGSH